MTSRIEYKLYTRYKDETTMVFESAADTPEKLRELLDRFKSGPPPYPAEWKIVKTEITQTDTVFEKGLFDG